MNVIVVLAIGDKYEAILEQSLPQFQAYANKCNVVLEICRQYPDPSRKDNLFKQKLLLPDIYKKYKWIAFFDLDILISKFAPSIFDFAQEDKGFGAILDPRGTPQFEYANIHWHKQPALNKITPTQIGIERGFPENPDFIGTINGGVWLARPSLVGNLFSQFYWNSENQVGSFIIHEEVPMAYLSQTQNLFFPISEQFNSQVLYLISKENTKKSYFLCKVQKKINKRIFKFAPTSGYQFMFPQYNELINQLLLTNHIIHFSGNFPIPKNLPNALRNDR